MLRFILYNCFSTSRICRAASARHRGSNSLIQCRSTPATQPLPVVWRLSAQTGMLVLATSTFHRRADHGFYAFITFVKIKRSVVMFPFPSPLYIDLAGPDYSAGHVSVKPAGRPVYFQFAPARLAAQVVARHVHRKY